MVSWCDSVLFELAVLWLLSRRFEDRGPCPTLRCFESAFEVKHTLLRFAPLRTFFSI